MDWNEHLAPTRPDPEQCRNPEVALRHLAVMLRGNDRTRKYPLTDSLPQLSRAAAVVDRAREIPPTIAQKSLHRIYGWLARATTWATLVRSD
jgi:hypothetical protein